MSEEFLRSWSFEPGLAIVLVAAAIIYARGAWRGRHAGNGRRSVCYFGGLLALWVALAGPFDAFAPLLLSAHMAQHLLLVMVAAPLVLLGEPYRPLLRGLPRIVRVEWVAPFLAAGEVRAVGRALTHPVAAWCAGSISLVAWHVPPLYELALRDPAWHRLEHAWLFWSAILFWWPVIQPAPSRARWPRWAMVPYLLLADVVNTIVGAAFAFSPSVIYPTYATTAPALGVSALRDQAAAGALMWVPGSLLYLVPAVAILVRVMGPRAWARPRAGAGARPIVVAPPRGLGADGGGRALSLPQWGANHAAAAVAIARPALHRFDLLRVPVIGPLLRARSARLALRGVMFLLAIVIVLDGFLGPTEAPMNLAGTLPWTHWRGVAVILLLVAGNFLCMTCPFVLPRLLARTWRQWIRAPSPATGVSGLAAPSVATRSRWPSLLRNKWLAVALLAAWLVCYEAFDLWANPGATAMLIVGYVVAAIGVDAFAGGGAFCKWVCPLGQFHFAQSTLAPLTVGVRDPNVCARCTTHDCIRGNERRNGCELELFVARKTGNIDCTFCLDCVDACPHSNVGVLAQSIGGELRTNAWRSSLGRLLGRADLATLLLTFTIGAIANAAGMTAPVLESMAVVSDALGWPRSAGAALVIAAMLLAPVAAVVGVALLRVGGGGDGTLVERYARIAVASVPLGAACWLVHFAFHLVTSWRTAGPVAVRAAHDAGLTMREPEWTSSCCALAPSWLLPTNLLVLSLGLALALWTLWRSVGGASPLAHARTAAARAAPGAIVLMALWAAAAWVFLQPMDMRGTLGWAVSP